MTFGPNCSGIFRYRAAFGCHRWPRPSCQACHVKPASLDFGHIWPHTDTCHNPSPAHYIWDMSGSYNARKHRNWAEMGQNVSHIRHGYICYLSINCYKKDFFTCTEEGAARYTAEFVKWQLHKTLGSNAACLRFRLFFCKKQKQPPPH